jgi:hypothetical protein
MLIVQFLPICETFLVDSQGTLTVPGKILKLYGSDDQQFFANFQIQSNSVITITVITNYVIYRKNIVGIAGHKFSTKNPRGYNE